MTSGSEEARSSYIGSVLMQRVARYATIKNRLTSGMFRSHVGVLRLAVGSRNHTPIIKPHLRLLLADLEAQKGVEVELLSDQEIIQLLSDEVVPQNEDYTLEDAQRDFCIEPFEDYAYEDWN